MMNSTGCTVKVFPALLGRGCRLGEAVCRGAIHAGAAQAMLSRPLPTVVNDPCDSRQLTVCAAQP